MKKLLYLLFAVTLFTACSSDDDKTSTQNHTSFVVYYDVKDVNKLPNCVAAYKRDNEYYKLANLGDLTSGKYSEEISLASLSFPVTEIYIFSDYNGVIRFNKTFKLTPNIKNVIDLTSIGGVDASDKSDPSKYPQ